MALIDDPRTWIVRLFAAEEREGRGRDCQRFPDGERPAGVPLAPEERVYGIYKRMYFFTPQSLILKTSSGWNVKFEERHCEKRSDEAISIVWMGDCLEKRRTRTAKIATILLWCKEQFDEDRDNRSGV